jgi:hypothetical protein
MTRTSSAAMMLLSAFEHLDWIALRPVLFIAGERAQSRIFSEQAFEKAAQPKHLHLVPGAGHVDLYNRVHLIRGTRSRRFFLRTSWEPRRHRKGVTARCREIEHAVHVSGPLGPASQPGGGPQSPDLVKGFGTSEEIIGRWLAQGGRRDRIVLATKLCQPMGTGPNDRGLSAYHIRRACEASLRRLQTDHIDLYQMHHVDRRTPWDEIWQAMEQLVREGKVTYVGSSNFAGWDIATAQSVAASRHSLGLASEQSLYNLSARTVELEVTPALRYFGIGLIPWSPIGMGLLGGALRKARDGRRAAPQLQMRIAQHRAQLEQYEALCQDSEEPADEGGHVRASRQTDQRTH